jgi:hypothetical protein
LAIIACVGLIIGFYARFSALILFLVLGSIHVRNPIVQDSDDALLRVIAFYFIFQPKSDSDGKIHIWALRLFQFQLCLIYFASGIAKLQSAEWLNGSALRLALLNPAYGLWDFSRLLNSQASFILVAVTFVTLIWELSFPVLIFTRLRFYLLAVGVVFHLGTAVSLNLRMFPFLMLLLYGSFLDLSKMQKRFGEKPKGSRVD